MSWRLQMPNTTETIGMDKPRPPRRGYPSDYPETTRYEEPSYPQVSSGTVNTVAGKVFEAYRINPVMIAMIVLLLTILAALGWYMMRNDDRIYSYIALRDTRERDLNDRLIEMALKCRDQPADKSAYPQPNFPNLTGGGKAFQQNSDGTKR